MSGQEPLWSELNRYGRAGARLAAAEAARDAALQQVAEHTPSLWLHQAVGAVQLLAGERQYFTTDDVWDLLDSAPPEPRALGAVMREQARAGLIVATDRTQKSRRVECHARPVRVWRSLVHGAAMSEAA